MQEQENEKNEMPGDEKITDAASAAKARAEDRRAFENEPHGEEYPHEESDEIVLKEEKSGRITLWFILKCIFFGVCLLVFILMLYRIHQQKIDYADLFVWTEEALAAYQEKGSLTVFTQEMGSFTLTLERDENNQPTQTYSYQYSPYSRRYTDADDKRNDSFYGVFYISDPMYVKETGQMILTLRVNRKAGQVVQEHYQLDTAPTKDAYFFTLTDGITTYTAYDYITIEKDTYFYYRLVFQNVKYEPLILADHYKDDSGNLDITASDITELNLNVYLKSLYNLNSPLAIMNAANSALPTESYDLAKEALPAELPKDLKEDHTLADSPV